MGGAVTDAGNFDWSQNDKFPLLTEPDPAYNGLKYHETFGKMAFFIRSIALGLRDLGMMQTPMNAFLTMTGMETLPLRMQKHTDNALKVAKFLEKHPKVEWVSYAGLDSSPYKKLVKKYMPNGAGAVFTCGVTGGYAGGKGVVENAELFSHVANIGDTRSLIIHPASTTHSQLSSEERTKIGIHDNAVRLSIGIEHADDIIADLDQALAKI
jgi:O-acetylhomoserine (thiol)-lyase